jgi:hypothetical protein
LAATLLYKGLRDVEPIDEWLKGYEEGYDDGVEARKEEDNG